MKNSQIFAAALWAFAFLSASLQAQEHPEATATSDPNVVVSPFGENKKIDVTGFLPGDLARDPHTNKVFRVPAKMSTPLVFKPEIIEDDPATSAPENLPIRRPKIVGDPESGTPEIPARPRAVAESDLPPLYDSTLPNGLDTPPAVVEPIIPARSPRDMDEKLTDFVREFIRGGQQNDPTVQAQHLASELSSYYGIADATKEQVIQNRTAFIANWPRRIYVESGKPRFVQWITEKTDDEFILDIRVYQSLKNTAGTTSRGYADHRLSIRTKADGTFEITAAEERHPRSVLAGQ